MHFLKKEKKYKFNLDTLQYEKDPRSARKTLGKVFKHFIVSIITAVVVIVLYTLLYPLYVDNNIKRENVFLKEQLSKIENEINNLNVQLDTLAKNDNKIYRTLLGKDTISTFTREGGTGGQNKYKEFNEYSNSYLIEKARNNLEKVKSKVSIQEKSQKELISILKDNTDYFKKAPLLEPIHVNNITSFSSNFGYRLHPVLGIIQFHKGIDITASKGSAVLAAGDGVVTFSGSRGDGYGNAILIDHQTRGLSSRYAHLSKILVKRGEVVVRGQKIGEVGNTGLSTAPHLHFEILKNGEAINPMRYIFTPSADSYEMLIFNARQKQFSLD